MVSWQVKDFTPEEFVQACISTKLGFEDKGTANHGHKLHHPTIKPDLLITRKPNIIVPRNVKYNKAAQSSLIRTLVRGYGFTLEQVHEALKINVKGKRHSAEKAIVQAKDRTFETLDRSDGR
ncbi:hypothetical protein KGQ71_05025 [Patescibacteria group bacterium]|nr:hypothetical protein [Patescibacteria group bacterium]